MGDAIRALGRASRRLGVLAAAVFAFAFLFGLLANPDVNTNRFGLLVMASPFAIAALLAAAGLIAARAAVKAANVTRRTWIKAGIATALLELAALLVGTLGGIVAFLVAFALANHAPAGVWAIFLATLIACAMIMSRIGAAPGAVLMRGGGLRDGYLWAFSAIDGQTWRLTVLALLTLLAAGVVSAVAPAILALTFGLIDDATALPSGVEVAFIWAFSAIPILCVGAIFGAVSGAAALRLRHLTEGPDHDDVADVFA